MLLQHLLGGYGLDVHCRVVHQTFDDLVFLAVFTVIVALVIVFLQTAESHLRVVVGLKCFRLNVFRLSQLLILLLLCSLRPLVKNLERIRPLLRGRAQAGRTRVGN